MPRTLYKTGDTVTLKSRNHGELVARQIATVVAVMPEQQGTRRLRVRLEGENFDGTLGMDDIDPPTSTGRNQPDATHTPSSSGGWIDQNRVRTRK